MFVVPKTLLVLSNDNLAVNTAPTVPGSINVPTTVKGGGSVAVSWAASSDAEANLSGYKLERSVNGGGWSQIYQGTAASCTDSITFGWNTVAYRVRAYDAEGAHSGYRTSDTRTVINNTAPTVPGNIIVPTTVIGGGKLTISWAASSDAQSNLSGYKLERSVAGGAWGQIYQGTALSYQDAITKGWATVAYRVRAFDSDGAHSDYRTSETRTVDNNTAPTITCGSSGDLGVKAAGFSVSYSVADAEGDTVTVTEAMDGAVKRTYTATLGANNSFAVTGEYFTRLLNGAHTMTIRAADPGGKSNTVTLTFTKSVTGISFTLTTPLAADAMPTKCILTVTRAIPAGAAFKVEACNNGFDDAPAWEDVTNAVLGSSKYFFTNKAKSATQWGVNVRVTVQRNGTGGDCYIHSVGGNFE